MQENSSQATAYETEKKLSSHEISARERLSECFNQSPLPVDDLMFNLGLYVRSSLLVKFLVMDELYKRIKTIPGQLFEFGVWWGQNLVLLENLRAIHEPFNKQRKIIGFDTFDGYESTNVDSKGKDIQSPVWQKGAYSTGVSYEKYLSELLRIHEQNNILGNQTSNHVLVKGDVIKTVPRYITENPATTIALAYFDIGLYEPTVKALSSIKPCLVPGSVILLDEFTWEESPGEAIAFKEVFNRDEYTIEKCELYPSKVIVTIK